MSELQEHPGLLFVAATLLPLASFVLLLLWAGLRWGLRPYAKESETVNTIFQAIGGEVTGPGPAYVALGAIALAFVCSLTGFILFVPDAHHLHHVEHEIHVLETKHADKHGEHHGEQQEQGDKKKPADKDEPKGEDRKSVV